MLALGFEEDTSNFISGIKRSWGIALFGALAPFAAAYSISMYFWQDPNLFSILQCQSRSNFGNPILQERNNLHII
jgi:Kef-type K+ transport system membrane component KefB